MRKLLTIAAALLLACAAGLAQVPQGLVSYTVKVPEGTLTQGQWITVVYILEATNYEVDHVSTEDGIHLETFNQAQYTYRGIRRLTTSCTYQLTGAGKITVPALNVKVDGVPITPEPTVIDVRPNPKYGREWEMARAFLQDRGITVRHLTAKYTASTLAAFSDDATKAFAIVAANEYATNLDNPVLAYGIGNSMWDGSGAGGDNSIYHILGRYDAQLRLIREKGQMYHSLPYTVTGKKADGVAPLLDRSLDIGQHYPYNRLFPKHQIDGKDSTCLAGCGPVALTQILAFNGQKEDIPRTLLRAAKSVKAEMDPSGTSSALVNFKGALINDWNYSPQCTYFQKRPDLEMLSMIYAQLDSGRPVIVADAGHIFVCDGYFEDFLHLNLGWSGYCNGYYRAIVLTSDHRRQLAFNEILIGIEPLRENENLALSIKVKKPGTLESTLRKEMNKKKNLSGEPVSLKVSGKINGNDIAVLRKLAGAVSYDQRSKGHGSLMDLDLADATILGGGYYVTQSANKMTFSGAVVTPAGQTVQYRYDMSRLAPGQWEEMQALGLASGPSWVIQPDSAGGFSVSWMAVEKTVGPHMFSDCQNLRTLVLPKDTREVGANAFFGCRALRNVTGLPASVAENAFDNTLLSESR